MTGEGAGVADVPRPGSLLDRSVPATRSGVVASLGPVDDTDDDGLAAVRLHEHLLGRPAGSVTDRVRLRPFSAGGRVFWWLEPVGDPAALDAAVALHGHTVTAPPPAFAGLVTAALDRLAGYPDAFAMVERFVSNLALVAFDRSVDGARPVTSCSLPEFPLSVFLSTLAARHVPPRSVARDRSALLLAENLFHESVHQFVNHQLLTRPVLAADYDSATSPRIPIYWRRDDRGRPQTWELDRVLHAAMVYSQLVGWRQEVLAAETLTDQERVTLLDAAGDSVGALLSLCDALSDHLELFRPYGAYLVGRLVETARHRCALLRWQVDTMRGGGRAVAAGTG